MEVRKHSEKSRKGSVKALRVMEMRRAFALCRTLRLNKQERHWESSEENTKENGKREGWSGNP